MAGGSERPAMSERRRRKPKHISREGMVHLKAVRTRQTFADVVVVSPRCDRKSKRPSQGAPLVLLLHVAHTSGASLGEELLCFGQKLRSTNALKNLTPILSTIFGK